MKCQNDQHDKQIKHIKNKKDPRLNHVTQMTR